MDSLVKRFKILNLGLDDVFTIILIENCNIMLTTNIF